MMRPHRKLIEREEFFRVLRQRAGGSTGFAIVSLFVPDFLYRQRFDRQPWDPEAEIADVVRIPPRQALVTRVSWAEFWLLLDGTREEATVPVDAMRARLKEWRLSGSWRLACTFFEPPIDDVDSVIRDFDWMSDNVAEARPSLHAFTMEMRRRLVTPRGPDGRCFQLGLLPGMRATAQVEAARFQLGASAREMAEARERIEAAGFMTITHDVGLYVSFLGRCCETAWHASSDRHRVNSVRFQLPLWKGLDFVVYAHANGTVGDVRFERGASESEPAPRAGEFEVWRTVEDDLPGTDWRWEVGDEWYPMKDFIGTHQDGRQICLCFDYGLLQTMGPLTAPARTKARRWRWWR